jgi:N-methylhydantoinase A/oxoprolinase/acetone carboxylase beta subunit
MIIVFTLADCEEEEEGILIIGLDMGGTNVDAVIIENGTIINTVKKTTDRNDLFKSIWSTLEELLSGYDKSKIKKINLSTTVSTNAIVEGKTSPVGMIIQCGPGIPHDFLACGDENVFITGYIDHRGKVIKDLDLGEVEKSIQLFKDKNIKNCAVITKFSTRNSSHELRVKSLIENDFSFVTMGHSLSGKLNFPRRVFTAYLNSAVFDAFKDFSDNIKKSMEKEGINAPLFMLKADGGTTSLNKAEEKPVETILSGPAASFMGLNAMLGTEKDAILLDIGGTTTDIFFLADGVPLFEPLGIEIGSYKTLVRAIYSVSIGLGGDSSINIIDDEITIGPKREGQPYAYGGTKPTPTDAMIALGFIKEGDRVKALESMNNLGVQLNLSAEDTAKKILNIMGDSIKNKVDELLDKINAHPVYTIEELLHGKKLKPELINVIGGPAKVLAPILEKKFDLPCHYPENYHVANAVGAALAKTTTEITMFVDTFQKKLSVPELGVYENINRNYSIDNARETAIELLKKRAISLGASEKEIEAEITEESIFNMVRGFYTSGHNIRIKAQVKPGLIYHLRGGRDD